MNLRVIAAALLAAGATFSLTAQADAPALEEMGIEASSDNVTLPASVPGAIVFSACAACNRSPLRITATTQLLLGNKPITLAQLSTLAHAGNARFMMVYYHPGSPDVTRIAVPAR
jgi:hypothetical protein